MPKERYISPEKRQNITNNLRLIYSITMEHQKTAEATGDLIGNKIADRITKFLKNSQQNNLETVTNENYKEIPKERYISQEERQNVTDNIRLI